MSDISAISPASPGRFETPNRISDRAEAVQASRVARGEDRVELSDEARYLQKLIEVPPVREDLVARVRAQIEAGTYDTPDRMNQALDALLDDLHDLP